MQLQGRNGQRFFHSASKFVLATSYCGIVALTAMFRSLANPGELPDFLFIQEMASIAASIGGELFIGFLVASVLSGAAIQWTGNPWAWEQTDAVMNELGRHVFTKECAQDPAHHNRVTLFRYVKWRAFFRLSAWRAKDGVRTPWSGWLMPVSRSGHLTQKTDCLFLAADDGEAEGIAGKAWLSGTAVRTEGLCELNKNATEDEIRSYCRDSNTPESYIGRRMKATGRSWKSPRALLASPIMVDHFPWGVVVVDSRRPNGIEDTETVQKTLQMAQHLLSRMSKNL